MKKSSKKPRSRGKLKKVIKPDPVDKLAVRVVKKNPVMCAYCAVDVTNVNYTEHLKTDHPGKCYKKALLIEPLRCTECEFTCRRRDVFNRHLVLSHDSGDRGKVYCKKCTLCPESFQSKAMLESHMHLKHGSEKQYACGDCGQKYSNKITLRMHMTEKHDYGTKRMCPHCGIEMGSVSYQQHVRLHHPETRKTLPTYPCPECGKSFKRPVVLRQHLAFR